MISAESLNSASAIVDVFTDQEMEQEFARFLDTQPVLVDLLAELTRGRSPMLLELLLYESYFVSKAYEIEYPDKSMVIKPEDMSVASDQLKAWKDQLRTGDARNVEPEAEPMVIAYIIAEFKAPISEGVEPTQDDQNYLLAMMKIVIFALSHAAMRQGIQAS